MSLLFPCKPYSEVNDFYESLQNNYDPNEGFGKYVSGNLQMKNMKKVLSSRDTKALMTYEQEARKNFSTQSFQESDYEYSFFMKNRLNYARIPNYYAKQSFEYRLEDHSTKGSFTSMTSLTSVNSMLSMTNGGNISNNSQTTNKSKAKGNRSKKKNSGDTDYRKKYKTEPCKYYAEKGFCEYGDQCAFAHGNNEIRQKPNLSSNYKTKKCTQFHETGYCPYGVRCQFIHNLRKDCQLNPVLENTSYVEAMENAELWVTHDPDCVCMQNKARRRFPSFQQVSTEISSHNASSEDADIVEKAVESLLENSF